MSKSVGNRWLNTISLALVAVAAALLLFKNWDRATGPRLLNVSYDPTRELYREIDQKFAAQYRKESATDLTIDQSHGGSSHQAAAVASGGLAADVVTLALPSDIDLLSRYGLVAGDWRGRFPNESQPYYSTIIFVVRKGNPKHIRDWPDLVSPGVVVITPDPRTSGNGKLSFLAAWGSVTTRGGNEEQARAFVKNLFQHVPVLGQGARESSNTFALGGEGDVHLTWEDEALREANASNGDLQIVYPPVSIRAEPSVTWVDVNIVKHGAAAAAKAYLAWLFTDEAQEVLARNGYRPINAGILEKHRDTFPDIQLFRVTLIARDWQDAQERFFGENGVFNIIHREKSP